jgi:cell division ATPase FtsA
MGSVLIFAASMATMVEVYVEQLDVIVSEQPEITEEWVAKVLEHADGEEVSREMFIIAALEQFGVIDHKKHVRPLMHVS